MKPTEYVKLEKDKSFKYSYFGAAKWWKNFSLVPPVILLFGGLIGVVFLLNTGRLATWYVVPYIVLFVLGTVWFKATKKHLQKQLMDSEDAFRVCSAAVAGEGEGYVYAVYTTGDKRHNEYYIDGIADRLDVASLTAEQLAKAKKKAITLHDDETGTDFALRAYFHSNISRRNPDWRDNNSFPLICIHNRTMEIVRKRDLMDAEVAGKKK